MTVPPAPDAIGDESCRCTADTGSFSFVRRTLDDGTVAGHWECQHGTWFLSGMSEHD